MIRTEELKGLTRDEVIDKLRGAGYKYHTDTPLTLGWELNKELTKAGLRGKTVQYIDLTYYSDDDIYDDTYTIVEVWDYIPTVYVGVHTSDRSILFRNGKYLWDLEK